MNIQVLAFMQPLMCNSTKQPIFYKPQAIMIQQEGLNGLLFENGIFTELERALDSEAVKDVLSIFQSNKVTTSNQLEGHPFCQRNIDGNVFVALSDERYHYWRK